MLSPWQNPGCCSTPVSEWTFAMTAPTHRTLGRTLKQRLRVATNIQRMGPRRGRYGQGADEARPMSDCSGPDEIRRGDSSTKQSLRDERARLLLRGSVRSARGTAALRRHWRRQGRRDGHRSLLQGVVGTPGCARRTTQFAAGGPGVDRATEAGSVLQRPGGSQCPQRTGCRKESLPNRGLPGMLPQ